MSVSAAPGTDGGRSVSTPVDSVGGDNGPDKKLTDPVEVLRALVKSRPDGESRPQQEQMVRAVQNAITTNRHLVVQAGTGTGKSLGYLIPAILSGKRVVISTATKALGEQLVKKDLPALAEKMAPLIGRTFTYSLSKGRHNFVCLAKVDELYRLDATEPGDETSDIMDALFDVDDPSTGSARDKFNARDTEDLKTLLEWVKTTETGDRSDAPPVHDRVWNQVSTDAAGCPGPRVCPFATKCFSEFNRQAAIAADIVVTNHAQVAHSLTHEDALFDRYDILIVDEEHELVPYLSSAWGSEFSPTKVKRTLAMAGRTLPAKSEKARDRVKEAIKDVDAVTDLLTQEDGGLKPELPAPVTGLLKSLSQKVLSIGLDLTKSARDKDAASHVQSRRKGEAGKMEELGDTILTMLASTADVVRWLEPAYGNRKPVLKTAPLWVGPLLQERLGVKTLIATSATITVGGRFDNAIRELGLGTAPDGVTPRPFDTLDVGTPFDYPRQGMLYIPDTGFPEPVGATRTEHTAAVRDETVALVTASGGRALILCTTTKATRDIAEHLRAHLDTTVLCQGDAMPRALVTEFRQDEQSTLCATMGFWHGIDVPGPALSLVVMDKLPFAPMNDPLMAARRADADKNRRNGFTEVFVAAAAINLAQGSGRLIRSATDKGVVAILDRRLLTKSYGGIMLAAIPPFGRFSDRDTVTAALARLTGSAAPAKAGATPSPAREATPAAAATKTSGKRRRAPSAARTRTIAKRAKR